MEPKPGTESSMKVHSLSEIISEFNAWRRRIKPLFTLLNKVPSSDIEIGICSDENQFNDENPLFKDFSIINKCEELHKDLSEEVHELKVQAKDTLNEVLKLWDELEEKENLRLNFTYAEHEILKSAQLLQSKLMMRKTEKHQKIASYIGELRTEISEIWEQCMITDEEKHKFTEFYDEDFTEELLDIHQEELKKWQIYHKKNQEILVKIKQREDMWKTLRELEARAEDPNRFINRGGTLLKDQNMHNSVTKNLPKLEAELIKLAAKFEKEHGRKMTILGKEIPIMIEEEWQAFKAEKTARKNSRLNQAANSDHSSMQSVPFKSRQSLMPPRVPMPTSSGRCPEKRPASRPVGGTPNSKHPKLQE